jgi:hypothetical protein
MGLRLASLQGAALGRKWHFFKIYIICEFLYYRDMAYLFGNIWTRAKKIGSRTLIIAVGPKILGIKKVVACITCSLNNHLMRVFQYLLSQSSWLA